MANASSVQSAPSAKSRTFGTFLGVYTPSVLTILGVIMYLRFGWVVGNLGVVWTAVTVCVATGITALTALSASAVATNMRVGVGGEYFLISRSLGLELGGAIGIPLFLCRTLSVTLYCFGLAESIAMLLPAESLLNTHPHAQQVLAGALIVGTTLIAGKSAKASLLLQLPIMGLVGLSLLALAGGMFTGGVHRPEVTATFPTAEVESFWYVFAVFFPAVTGFTAGIGMSGDLADPQRAIPRGTLLAVATGGLVYLIVPFLLAVSTKITADELAQPGVTWGRIAVGGMLLIYPGMWGAVLSSAFGSALGGPRVLQALAADGLAPRFLARTSRTGQPTLATWVTGAIALAAVMLGGLNAVAEWVTIFFLTLYVTINLAAAAESLVRDPSYRPTIRVPWPLSLAGAIAAVAVMFLINRWACIAAVGLEGLLWLVLRHRALQRRWGDVRAGFWVALARFALLELKQHALDARNWRPHILLFAGDVAKRIGLVRMASWFNQDRGVLTICDVMLGSPGEDVEEVRRRQEALDAALAAHRLAAFGEVNVVRQFEPGVIDIVQANGIAGLQSNTVMFGWSGKRERLEANLRIMRSVVRLGKSMILARVDPPDGPRRRRRIDVWWRGKQNNGDLMLLLAYLLNLNAEWHRATIRVRSIVADADEREAMQASLAELVSETRIDAEVDAIIRPPERTAVEVMHAQSRDADVVILGLRLPDVGEEAAYAERLRTLIAGFRTVILVRNGSPFAGHLI